jgi:glycerophosphoryl diester phosphodiesterase
VRVLAHRGASEKVAEHTLAAYEQALHDGADGVECDVRLTADGHLVCVHDRTVDRTSNGSGVVSTLELSQMQDWDFAAGRHGVPDALGELPERDRTGILTLRRLLAMVQDYERPIEVAVETKHPTRYAGLVERRLVELLGEFGLVDRGLGRVSPVRVMSFSWLSLRRVRRLAPGLRTVFLMEELNQKTQRGVLPLGVPIAGPGIALLREDPKLASRFIERGHQVHVWVVNDEDDVRLCQDLGVTAVISDRPAAVRELISSA